MKLKFFILISFLLLVPLTSGGVYNTQPLECITSEVEGETYVNTVKPIVDDITIEDGGNLGSEGLLQNYVDIQHIEIPVESGVGSFSDSISLNQRPHYIKYCRLKIAC